MVGIEIGKIVQLKVGEAVIVVAPRSSEEIQKETPEKVDQRKEALDDLGIFFQQNLEEIEFSRGSANDRDNLFMSSKKRAMHLAAKIDNLGICEEEVVSKLKSCLQSAGSVDPRVNESIIKATLETLDLAREAIINMPKK